MLLLLLLLLLGLLGFLLLLSDILDSLKLFISHPIVIKLRTQIADNIVHLRTVFDFQVKF